MCLGNSNSSLVAPTCSPLRKLDTTWYKYIIFPSQFLRLLQPSAPHFEEPDSWHYTFRAEWPAACRAKNGRPPHPRRGPIKRCWVVTMTQQTSWPGFKSLKVSLAAVAGCCRLHVWPFAPINSWCSPSCVRSQDITSTRCARQVVVSFHGSIPSWQHTPNQSHLEKPTVHLKLRRKNNIKNNMCRWNQRKKNGCPFSNLEQFNRIQLHFGRPIVVSLDFLTYMRSRLTPVTLLWSNMAMESISLIQVEQKSVKII